MNIITTLKSNLHLEKYAVHLSDNEKQYINVLMEKNPEVFTKIQQTMDEIMADGVVDLHDIPKIILLISQMYQANVLVEFVKHIRLLSLVKFTIDCLLDSGLLPIPQVEVVIIKRIVDTTIDLLSTNMDTIVQGTIQKTKKCRTWMYWLLCSEFDDDPDNGCSRIFRRTPVPTDGDDLRPDEVGSTPSSPNVPCPTGRRPSGFGSSPEEHDACGCSRTCGCLSKDKPCKCDPCECEDCTCGCLSKDKPCKCDPCECEDCTCGCLSKDKPCKCDPCECEDCTCTWG